MSRKDRAAARRSRRRGRRSRGDRRGGRSEWERYKMTQKLVSLGDDYYVENESGERVFRIDGKALRVRDTLVMEDLRTGDRYKLQTKLLRIRNTMTIAKNGRTAATVKRALITPIRDRFTVAVPESGELLIRGNVLDHEYRFKRSGDRVAEVSKKWFRVRDSYGIEVSPAVDAGLVVAATVALDTMANPGR